jgi:ketosteroid isomerase-like protein
MTTATNEKVIRAAYEAYSQGDIEALLAVFSPDLEWTYLDPSVENPAPQVCRGLPELRRALRRQAGQRLKAKVEEVHVNGSEVVAVIHIPGLDQLRARKATIVTMRCLPWWTATSSRYGRALIGLRRYESPDSA